MEIKYSKTEALKITREIIVKGSIVPTSHLRQRMKERDFDMQDVLYCLNTGRIIREPEKHEKTEKWIYTVEGTTVEGKKMKVPVNIDKENNRLTILTGLLD
jgi:hypothetical protein